MSDAPHILIVDDDSRIRALLTRFLKENGFLVSSSDDAANARILFSTLLFDLIILDVMMPGEDGFSLAKAIRSDETSAPATTPFLMLTAKGEQNERIEGLESGADDYLAKPFEPKELLLRINAILRRVQQAPPQILETVSFGSFQYSLKNQELRLNGTLVKLTDRDKEMLKTLCLNANETVPRFKLAALGEEVNDRTVDVQITRLRRKLGDDSENPALIQTIRGVGYRLVAHHV